ncbi:MAG: hypothetical protein IJF78_11995 [Clostridia bacterium]|nr:hypothetical protein [Clostridia bacterium]
MSLFSAVTDRGEKLLFREEQSGESHILLTLPLQAFGDCGSVTMFGDFTTRHAGDCGFYLLPRNLGMTGEMQTFFTPRENTVFSYDKPVLSLFVMQTEEFTALVRLERNYKFTYTVTVEDNVYRLTVSADFTRVAKDNPYDDIRAEVIFLPAGISLGKIAEAERNLRLKRGEITTLREKCGRAPVEYARNHPLIRIRMGWKPSPSPVLHQTVDNEPEMYTACTFARVRDIADALLEKGVTGADLQLVGWNISGHDGRFPQLFPVDERLGGEKELRKTIEYVKSLGFAISLHTNLIDTYEIADTFTWEDVCVLKNGDYIQMGHYSGGLAYHVCPHRQLEINRRELPRVAQLGTNGMHYIDVISIVEPDCCFAENHPCTTADGITAYRQIMEETAELFGSFSSEGCFDFAVPTLDYGLYVSFGTGFGDSRPALMDRDIPFWELIYHGILLYNPTSPTVNYPIKSPDARLSVILRGGRPSFYIYSRFRTGGAKNWMGEDDLTADNADDLAVTVGHIASAVCEYAAVKDLQTEFMTDYEILPCGIHVASYSNGVRIIGNFTDAPQILENRTIDPWGYVILQNC